MVPHQKVYSGRQLKTVESSRIEMDESGILSIQSAEL